MVTLAAVQGREAEVVSSALNATSQNFLLRTPTQCQNTHSTCSPNISWRICEWLQLWWSREWCFSRSNPCSSERWKQQPCVGKEGVLVTGRLQVSPRIWSDVLKSTPILALGNYQWQWNMRTLFFSKGGCLPKDILPPKLTHPLKINGWKINMKCSFKLVPFLWTCQFLWWGIYRIYSPTSLRRCPIRCRGSRRPMKPFKWPKVLESYRPQMRERGGCRNYGEDLLRYVYSVFGYMLSMIIENYLYI